MVWHCRVPGCPSRRKEIRHFALPYTHKNRFNAWVNAIPHLRKYTYHQLSGVRICARHFEPSCIIDNKLTKDAVPSLNLPSVPNNLKNNNRYLEILPLQRNPKLLVSVGPDLTQPVKCIVPSADTSITPSLDVSTVPSLDISTVPSMDISTLPSMDISTAPSLDISATPSLNIKDPLLIEDDNQSTASEIDSYYIMIETTSEPSNSATKHENVNIPTTSSVRTRLYAQKRKLTPNYDNLVKLNKVKHPDLYEFLNNALTCSNAILGSVTCNNDLYEQSENEIKDFEHLKNNKLSPEFLQISLITIKEIMDQFIEKDENFERSCRARQSVMDALFCYQQLLLELNRKGQRNVGYAAITQKILGDINKYKCL